MQSKANQSPDQNEEKRKLEADVQRAVAGGEDIQENVRRLTLMALGAEAPDMEALRDTISAVVRGAAEGVERQVQETAARAQGGGEKIAEAMAGLDSALAQFAESSKLAMEEAAGQARRFSDEELARTRKDLESLESLFFEILKGSAASAKGQAGEALRDLASHMELSGTAVGAKTKEAMEAVARQMATLSLVPFETGVKMAQAASDLMLKIAAGMKTGMEDRLKSDESKK